MFPDSEIACKMQLQKSQVASTVLNGITPFFTEKLMSLIIYSYFVVTFNNHWIKYGRVNKFDFHIRWLNREKVVSAIYWISSFLRNSTAADFQAYVPLDIRNIVKISMNGFNMNLKLLKDLRRL